MPAAPCCWETCGSAVLRAARESGDREPFSLREQEPPRHPQVVSRAGDIVRFQALDFLVDHPEIVSAGESLQADSSTEAVSEPSEQNRAEQA